MMSARGEAVQTWSRSRSRVLLKAGYASASDVARASAKDIALLPGFGPRIAEKITGKKMAGKVEDVSIKDESGKDGQQTLSDF